ncbi:DUF1624 domain-containing protein [Commensalibacter communis]|uniref:DUF1624 domain-containing protein n=1 Tax=Commensalibacter communis TaxID=2972786 RepID=UPI00232BC722|nr:heparan-alpha-glucosaminide N-acetyltransferase domain-containing protein [Commensalibacter communis]
MLNNKIEQSSQPISQRLKSVDMLRGIVILIMIIDHVRETFFLHLQVSDPMDVSITPLDLYLSRSLAHICAPIFVFLTGLSAYLYGQKQQHKSDVSRFLLIRGLFLVVLEITVINFAWTFEFPPHRLFLQVIWAIGLSMIVLSALIWLPRTILLTLAIIIIAGHNLLDHIHFSNESALYIPWAIIHDRVWVNIGDILTFRTTYPVLPWIGVISIGYYCGSWFKSTFPAQQRQKNLQLSALLLLSSFIIIRMTNIYGDHPWIYGSSTTETLMSFFNITKYPPSFLFLLITLSIGFFLLSFLERFQHAFILKYAAIFGSVPLFFYILHLFVLKFMYLGAVSQFGKNKGDYFGFNEVWQLWACWLALIFLLYPFVRFFSNYKATHKHIHWLKYL